MHVLVTAASKHGATMEIALAICDELTRCNVDAVLMPLGSVDSLETYDAVVLGSAIYMGRWLEPAKAFIDRHQEALLKRPVWLFSSGPLGDPLKPVDEPADVAELSEAVSARDHRVFAGRLVKRDLGLGERAMVAAVRAPEGDFRSWTEVHAWTVSIAEALQGEPASVEVPT
jgi:menaquinone-dependent protoporphyrinogen oxidase